MADEGGDGVESGGAGADARGVGVGDGEGGVEAGKRPRRRARELAVVERGLLGLAAVRTTASTAAPATDPAPTAAAGTTPSAAPPPPRPPCAPSAAAAGDARPAPSIERLLLLDSYLDRRIWPLKERKKYLV